MENIGKLVIAIGGVLVLVGLAIWLFGDKLSWVGSLPGDIKIERPGFSFYIPITTMILFSLGLSGLMWILGRLTQ